MTTFEFRRFDAALGAEIVGLDLSAPLDDETFAQIRHAFLESAGLLVFRDQHISPEDQIAFSRRFGPLMAHVLREYSLPGHPEILKVSNVIESGVPIGLGDAGRYWHSDLSYTQEPSLGSMLYALEIPAEGGDTSFANMTAAYDELPPEIKERLRGKAAIHSYSHRYDQLGGSKWRPPLSQAQRESLPEVAHPIVRTHPETGRKCLFVNEGFTARIIDLVKSESCALIEVLFWHSVQAHFVYRHAWRRYDLVFWDNRCTIHMAHGCPPHLRRHMHRTTIKGDIPYE